ncbi:MAG: hypothetical protein HFH49_01470 [Lachnospiraceae bacterium]|nr:hypothetical protein [Lachnospiraceae bacterium]
MKVQELRNLLSASDRKNLEKAFAESYKQLRKAQKEEIDPILTDILEGKSIEKKKTAASVSFEELEQQIKDFIENAYAQNYLAPNRAVPKNQRPKWRFLVKNFIKELEKIPPENSNYSKAVKLLTELYQLICEACNYYLFSTDDPFRSIGWEQAALFELLVKKTFGDGYSREKISSLLQYAATGGLSRESLHIYQEEALLHGLKTSDVKYTAMEKAKKLVETRAEKLVGLTKYSSKRFQLEDEINEFCKMILMTSIELSEPEPGLDYFFQHTNYQKREITLYCALDLISYMEADDLWLTVYENYGIKKKIKPRDYLVREYEERKNSV